MKSENCKKYLPFYRICGYNAWIAVKAETLMPKPLRNCCRESACDESAKQKGD